MRKDIKGSYDKLAAVSRELVKICERIDACLLDSEIGDLRADDGKTVHEFLVAAQMNIAHGRYEIKKQAKMLLNKVNGLA